jgi:hypothetical protein
VKKRIGCADSLSDKESGGTHQKFPGPSLTNTLGPGLWIITPPLPTAMMHIHILSALFGCVFLDNVK